MKKIFTLIAISLVTVFPIVSCSSDDVTAKQAETDRNDLVIPDDENNSNIKHNQLALYASATQVNVGTLVSFTTVLNGINVTNQATYYVNGLEIGGSSISSIFNGTFNVQAKLEGYIDSPIVTVIYTGGTATPNPTPNGNFILNGQSFNVTTNILVLNGAFAEEGNPTPFSSWTSIVLNANDFNNATVGAAIQFRTPFNITNPELNQGNIVLPNGTNETYTEAPLIFTNNQEFEMVTGNGTIHYNNNFDINGTTNGFTSNINFNGNTLVINYNGAYSFVNNSQTNERPEKKITTKYTKVSKEKNNSFILKR